VLSVLVTPRIVICSPLFLTIERFGTCSPRLTGLRMPADRKESPLRAVKATGVFDASDSVRWAVTTISPSSVKPRAGCCDPALLVWAAAAGLDARLGADDASCACAPLAEIAVAATISDVVCKNLFIQPSLITCSLMQAPDPRRIRGWEPACSPVSPLP